MPNSAGRSGGAAGRSGGAYVVDPETGEITPDPREPVPAPADAPAPAPAPVPDPDANDVAKQPRARRS